VDLNRSPSLHCLARLDERWRRHPAAQSESGELPRKTSACEPPVSAQAPAKPARPQAAFGARRRRSPASLTRRRAVGLPRGREEKFERCRGSRTFEQVSAVHKAAMAAGQQATLRNGDDRALMICTCKAGDDVDHGQSRADDEDAIRSAHGTQRARDQGFAINRGGWRRPLGLNMESGAHGRCKSQLGRLGERLHPQDRGGSPRSG
jgi:hypothetical protein